MSGAEIVSKKMKFAPKLNIKKCFESNPPPYDFVLPGFLCGTVGGLISPGGVGKSTWALEVAIQIACASAGGPDLLNLGQTQPGKVVIFSGEDPEGALWHRINDLKRHYTQDQRDALDKNLSIVMCIGLGVDLIDPEWLEFIEGESKGARLVLIDTLTNFHSLDENASRDAKVIMGTLQGIAHRAGAALLYLHHINKSAASSGSGDLQQAARGSSVFVDNARWLSFLAGMTEKEALACGIADDKRQNFLRWNISKQNYSGPRGDQWLVRGEGGILTACNLTFSDERPAAYRKNNKKNSGAKNVS